MIAINSQKRNRHISAVSIFLFLLIAFSSFNLYSQYSKVPGSFDKANFHLLPNLTGDASLDSVVRYDFTVTMRDNVIIDCLKFIPALAPPAGGWPTVIMVHGYGDNKETLANFCRAQAEYGYYTMTFSVRGQGNSGGLSNLISKTEMLDLLELINYVRADSVNGSGPNRILIMGGSQGGVLPYRAACNGAPVKTIITSVAPPNFASSWIENGSIKMTFLWTIDYTPDTARYTPEVDKMRSWVYANTKATWDSLYRTLPNERDFMTEVPNCTVPLMIEGSWQDKFFNCAGIIEGLSKLNVPFTSYLGAVQGHGGDHSSTEDQWHMNWFNDWFFYWLYDVQNGMLDRPKYQYASSEFPVVNNYWTFVHDSSSIPLPQASTNLRIYFNKNGKLKSTAGNNNDKISLANQVTGGLTMQQAVYDEFKGTTFNNKFKKASIVFNSNPLASSLEITGVPKVNVQYESNSSSFIQLNYQLYEVLPNGTSRFITRANYTDRAYVKNQKRTKNFIGQAHSHIFSAGSKIRIVITNFDHTPTDSAFLDSNPFVLPILANSTHQVYLNSQTYIDLPYISGDGSANIFTETPEQLVIPGSFELKQNYPNPFNPATTIEYSLGFANNVEIKVYDILGRETATLVNEYQQAGSHKILFNASNLSSGVYFYKIVSGSFQEVKRMVLVK
jgi:predicted acyl esterase